MGVKLFVRTTRSVHLTEAGAALLEPAERCLRLAEETMRVARGESMPPPMDLTLGTRHELGLSWVLPQFDRLEKSGLGCSCICTSDQDPIFILRVRTMEVDCAVTSTRFSDPKLDSLRLHREDYVLCGAATLLARQPLKRSEDAKHHALLDASASPALSILERRAPRWRPLEIRNATYFLAASRRYIGRILAGAGVGVLPEYLIVTSSRGPTARVLSQGRTPERLFSTGVPFRRPTARGVRGVGSLSDGEAAPIEYILFAI